MVWYPGGCLQSRETDDPADGQREDIFKLPGIVAAILIANLGIGLATPRGWGGPELW